MTRTIRIPARVRSRNLFCPLLSHDPRLRVSCEPLLSKATEFFRTDAGKQAGNLLHMCHMSLDSTFTIQALVVCVVLESLVKLLGPSKPPHTTVTGEQKEKIVACLQGIGLGERVVGRFSGFIEKMDDASPKNQLHAWAADGFLGITPEDAAAWDGMGCEIARPTGSY